MLLRNLSRCVGARAKMPMLVRPSLYNFSTATEDDQLQSLQNFGSIKRPRKIKTEFLADDAFPIDKFGMVSLPEQ